MNDLKEKIEKLEGPILVLGASGFIGCNILRTLLRYRDDVCGTYRKYSYRLRGINKLNLKNIDITWHEEREIVLDSEKPKTVFDCVAYGSYPFQKDCNEIEEVNFSSKIILLKTMIDREVKTYIHAGSSSEYGEKSFGPSEDSGCRPNSKYAMTKLAWSWMLRDYASKIHCANLRLYSVYGPYEDGSRLIPQVIQNGLRGEYPPFVRPDISRDFIYVDDVVEAFIDAANNLKPEDYGGSFNVGTGIKTTIRDIANMSKLLFDIKSEVCFSMPARDWDHAKDWYANPTKAKERLGWTYKTSLVDGIRKTVEWYKSQGKGWEWPTLKPPTA